MPVYHQKTNICSTMSPGLVKIFPSTASLLPKKENTASHIAGDIHLTYVTHSDNILFLHHAQGSVCVKLNS